MTATDDAADLGLAALDVLDRLHQLLTADQLYDGWRDDLDRAIRDATTVLDSDDHQANTDQPADAPRNPESGTPDESRDDAVKRCPRCDTVKSHDEFGRNRSAHDGLQTWCKACARAYNRRGDSTSDVANQARPARRLTEPTGQPPEPDPDTPAPAHARGVARTVPAMRRVT